MSRMERMEIAAELLKEGYIRKVPGKGYCIFSEKGKNLGCKPTKGEAEKRLQQIEYFKHKDGQLKQAIEDPDIDMSDFSLTLMREALGFFRAETYQQQIALHALKSEIENTLRKRHLSRRDPGDYDHAYFLEDHPSKPARTWFPEDPWAGYYAVM